MYEFKKRIVIFFPQCLSNVLAEIPVCKIVYRWNVERLQSNRKKGNNNTDIPTQNVKQQKSKKNQHPGNVKSGHHLVPVLKISHT